MVVKNMALSVNICQKDFHQQWWLFVCSTPAKQVRLQDHLCLYELLVQVILRPKQPDYWLNIGYKLACNGPDIGCVCVCLCVLIQVNSALTRDF